MVYGGIVMGESKVSLEMGRRKKVGDKRKDFF
jgi:hypothetical protein